MLDLAGLTIRVESPNADGVAALIACAASKESGDTVPTAEDLTQPNIEVLVARLDGTAVGCIVLMDHLRYAEMRRLYVAEDARGNGIAAALVAALESAARDIGLRRVYVSDTTGGAERRDTFSRLGFVPSASQSQRWLEKNL